MGIDLDGAAFGRSYIQASLCRCGCAQWLRWDVVAPIDRDVVIACGRGGRR